MLASIEQRQQRRRPKVCRARVAGEAHPGVPLVLGEARILFDRRKKARTWRADGRV